MKSTTMKRLDAVQAWPALPMRPLTACFTASDGSASSSTMKASLPPSSSVVFFKFEPARCHHRARRLTTGQRHTAHPRVVDQPGHLIFAGKQVDAGALGCACILKQLPDGEGAPRYVGGMLDRHHIARHQVGCCKPGHLVAGIVPRLDTKYHAQWASFHPHSGLGDIKRFGREKSLGVIRRSSRGWRHSA